MDYLKEGNDSVSVVILTRDQELEYFKKSLDSVLNQTPRPEQVIVVINASTGATVKFLKERNFNLEIIENNYNLGFTKAMNQGMDKAKSDYTLILVSDVSLEPDCLKVFLNCSQKEDNAGLLSGYLYDCHNQLISTGSKVSLGWDIKHHKVDESSVTAATDFILGGFIFSKTTLLKQLKGFDERFFIYFEDLDLSLRSKRQGFRNLITPQARAYHLEEGSGISKYRDNPKIQFELEKNILIIYFKHAKLFWLVLFFTRYMTCSFIKNIFNQERYKIILKSRYWAVCHLGDLIKARYFN